MTGKNAKSPQGIFYCILGLHTLKPRTTMQFVFWGEQRGLCTPSSICLMEFVIHSLILLLFSTSGYIQLFQMCLYSDPVQRFYYCILGRKTIVPSFLIIFCFIFCIASYILDFLGRLLASDLCLSAIECALCSFTETI